MYTSCMGKRSTKNKTIQQKCKLDAVPGVFTDKPSAPEGPLEVSDVWAEQVKLSWKPPKDNGGGEISGNSASARKQTLTEVEVLDANSNTISHVNCLVSGLCDREQEGFKLWGGGGAKMPDAIFNTHLVNCLVSGLCDREQEGFKLWGVRGGGGGGKNVPDAIFNTHLVNCLVSGYVIGSMKGSNFVGGGGGGGGGEGGVLDTISNTPMWTVLCKLCDRLIEKLYEWRRQAV